MFRPAKSNLSRVAEDLSNPALLSPFDALVQIFEAPSQEFSQGLTNTALASTHKANQNYSSPSRFAGLRLAAKHACLSRPFSTRLDGMRFALGFSYYFSERFLRWILPLKVRSTTVEETATRPMVPAKARPLSMGNQV